MWPCGSGADISPPPRRLQSRRGRRHLPGRWRARRPANKPSSAPGGLPHPPIKIQKIGRRPCSARGSPAADHFTLAGAKLDAELKHLKIVPLRTNDDLLQLLAHKQASLKQAEKLTEQLIKIRLTQALHDLTVVELQEMAKGISLNMANQGVIDLLDELEPGVDHKVLQNATLIDAKKKDDIGPLKNKEQLVKALEKAAGEWPAEKT